MIQTTHKFEVKKLFLRFGFQEQESGAIRFFFTLGI